MADNEVKFYLILAFLNILYVLDKIREKCEQWFLLKKMLACSLYWKLAFIYINI